MVCQGPGGNSRGLSGTGRMHRSLAQASQSLAKFLAAFVQPGHHATSRRRSTIFSALGWPVCARPRTHETAACGITNRSPRRMMKYWKWPNAKFLTEGLEWTDAFCSWPVSCHQCLPNSAEHRVVSRLLSTSAALNRGQTIIR